MLNKKLTGWGIDRLVNLEVLLERRIFRVFLPLCSIVLMLGALFYVFTVVPNEAVMGPVQRIFYFHVGSALSCWVMIALLFAGSIGYLLSRRKEWDLIGWAAAAMAFVLSTMVLASGMIWAHSAWNTWWRWEPRLVSFLILWLILFSYLMLRSFAANDHRQAQFAAVLGVLATVDIPIVVFSVKLFERTEQLHPQVMEERGLKDPRFVYALIIASVAMITTMIWLYKVKLTNILLQDKVKHLESEVR